MYLILYIFAYSIIVIAIEDKEIETEGWLSGRKRFTANEVRFKRLHGFESHTLRSTNKKESLNGSPFYFVPYVGGGFERRSLGNSKEFSTSEPGS